MSKLWLYIMCFHCGTIMTALWHNHETTLILLWDVSDAIMKAILWCFCCDIRIPLPLTQLWHICDAVTTYLWCSYYTTVTPLWRSYGSAISKQDNESKWQFDCWMWYKKKKITTQLSPRVFFLFSVQNALFMAST